MDARGTSWQAAFGVIAAALLASCGGGGGSTGTMPVGVTPPPFVAGNSVAAAVDEEGEVHFFAAGSTGSYLAISGVRMNKTAINAVLAASSLPLVP